MIRIQDRIIGLYFYRKIKELFQMMIQSDNIEVATKSLCLRSGYEEETMKNDEHKSLSVFLVVGFIIGACIGMIVSRFLALNIGFSIALGAGFGMLLGIVIGSVIDYERQKKEK